MVSYFQNTKLHAECCQQLAKQLQEQFLAKDIAYKITNVLSYSPNELRNCILGLSKLRYLESIGSKTHLAKGDLERGLPTLPDRFEIPTYQIHFSENSTPVANIIISFNEFSELLINQCSVANLDYIDLESQTVAGIFCDTATDVSFYVGLRQIASSIALEQAYHMPDSFLVENPNEPPIYYSTFGHAMYWFSRDLSTSIC